MCRDGLGISHVLPFHCATDHSQRSLLNRETIGRGRIRVGSSFAVAAGEVVDVKARVNNDRGKGGVQGRAGPS